MIKKPSYRLLFKLCIKKRFNSIDVKKCIISLLLFNIIASLLSDIRHGILFGTSTFIFLMIFYFLPFLSSHYDYSDIEDEYESSIKSIKRDNIINKILD